jgi:uncharacterized membrane protein
MAAAAVERKKEEFRAQIKSLEEERGQLQEQADENVEEVLRGLEGKLKVLVSPEDNPLKYFDWTVKSNYRDQGDFEYYLERDVKDALREAGEGADTTEIEADAAAIRAAFEQIMAIRAECARKEKEISDRIKNLEENIGMAPALVAFENCFDSVSTEDQKVAKRSFIAALAASFLIGALVGAVVYLATGNPILSATIGAAVFGMLAGISFFGYKKTLTNANTVIDDAKKRSPEEIKRVYDVVEKAEAEAAREVEEEANEEEEEMGEADISSVNSARLQPFCVGG